MKIIYDDHNVSINDPGQYNTNHFELADQTQHFQFQKHLLACCKLTQDNLLLIVDVINRMHNLSTIDINCIHNNQQRFTELTHDDVDLIINAIIDRPFIHRLMIRGVRMDMKYFKQLVNMSYLTYVAVNSDDIHMTRYTPLRFRHMPSGYVDSPELLELIDTRAYRVNVIHIRDSIICTQAQHLNVIEQCTCLDYFRMIKFRCEIDNLSILQIIRIIKKMPYILHIELSHNGVVPSTIHPNYWEELATVLQTTKNMSRMDINNVNITLEQFDQYFANTYITLAIINGVYTNLTPLKHRELI